MRYARHLWIPVLLLASFAFPLLSTAESDGCARSAGLVRGCVGVTPIDGSPGWFRLENHGSGWMAGVGPVEVTWVVPMVKLDLLRRTLTVKERTWGGVIRASNGDEIHGQYTFPSRAIPFSWLGRVKFDAVLDVTGGTGRFANATGQARSVGRANIFTRRFRIGFRGRLSVGGSDCP